MISNRSLKLFHYASDNVPAYKDFLKIRKIDPDSIVTTKDFKRIPIMSKKNYLQQYNLTELTYSNSFNHPLILCSTSGSTGTPFYFPRNDKLSWQYSWLIEDFLRNSSVKDEPTLVIVAFGMGVWIGGVITLRAFEIASARMDSSVSLLPVGYNKTEAIKALKQLSPQFKQTIIIGYPPFVKELVDSTTEEQIDLRKLKVRFIFAAEAFTETFRDYICRKSDCNPIIDTLNIYGTADIGAMAYETPISILIRRIARNNPNLFRSIFGQIEKTPTLGQYNSRFIQFENVDGEIILTGDSVVPLIRYSVGDHGGVISFSKMKNIFRRNGIDLQKEIDKAEVGSTLRKYPFIFVYERSDFSVTLYGINIYPEFIKEGLLNPDLIPYLTERFTMMTKYNRHNNQYLEVNLELQPSVTIKPHIRNLAKKYIRQQLIEKSSEFAEISKNSNSRNLIKLNFWPYRHPTYFSPGTKQKWVMK